MLKESIFTIYALTQKYACIYKRRFDKITKKEFEGKVWMINL